MEHAKLQYTGQIDAIRLGIASEIDGGKRSARRRKLESLLDQLTKAADMAEEAGL